MPSFADVMRNFQFEAFPLLFPTLIRAITNVFGTSDTVFRAFGFTVGVLLVGVLWLNARLLSKNPPLLSLALVGLNTTFLTWGLSVRGYGLGGVLILLLFGQMARTLIEPTPRRFAMALGASLLCVHCLLYNSVLLAAMAGPLVLVFLSRKQIKPAMAVLGIGALAAVSVIPYIGPYSSGSQWNMVLKYPVGLYWFWLKFDSALGTPILAMAIVWHALFAALVIAALWRLWKIRATRTAPEWDFLLFGAATCLSAPLAYYVFLRILSAFETSALLARSRTTWPARYPRLRDGLPRSIWNGCTGSFASRPDCGDGTWWNLGSSWAKCSGTTANSRAGT